MLRTVLSAGSRVVAARSMSSAAIAAAQHSPAGASLYDRMEAAIPVMQERVKAVKAAHGKELLGTCTVDEAYGGMRSVKSMVTETSLLDPEEGIRFRGLSIPELQQVLPGVAGVGKGEPLPEALLWLLLTGEVPSPDQTASLSADLARRAKKLPTFVPELIANLQSKGIHPMSQFAMAVQSAASESVFASEYAKGMHKSKYWQPALEDSLNLIAMLPRMAALIYRHAFHDGVTPEADDKLDWAANYAHMMGFTGNDGMYELFRLYQTIHSDHEGGNASAHATHLVASTLSDPYTSFTGGLTALAGPLHGLANQEVLRWTQSLVDRMGSVEVSDKQLTDALWDTLNAGQVIPGFGHAVLRKTDPRYTSQREFALKHLPEDPWFKLISQIYDIAPKVLAEQGKTKNPYPNVDAHSGVLLRHYNLKEETYYTVMFGVSRALGVLPSLVWDRALMLPLERPKSVTTGWLENHFAAKK